MRYALYISDNESHICARHDLAAVEDDGAMETTYAIEVRTTRITSGIVCSPVAGFGRD